MTTDAKPARKPRRRRTVGANTRTVPEPAGTIGLTPEQEAENTATQALIAVFGAISDAGKVAPLDHIVAIAMEAIAFIAGHGEGGREDIRRRAGEMKSELIGMLWET